MLTHLEDAFLVQVLPMATSSERQRQVNPRKVYPIDPGLIPAFDRSGKANIGQALETFVFLELKRRGHDVAYLRTPSGFEVDFLTTSPVGRRELFQVSADLFEPAVRGRELRAIADARTKGRRLPATLLTMTSADVAAVQKESPRWVKVRAAWEWALSEE
jgi:predicted AAA+ superfamily ATPase